MRRSIALGAVPCAKGPGGYNEAMALETSGAVMSGLLAVAIVVSSWLGNKLMAFSSLRKLIRPYLPQPGSGPSEEQLTGGRFTWYSIATAQGSSTPSSIATMRTTLGDPGYHETAVMVAATGMALALDKLNTPTGCLTPAAACGEALVRRLREAGFEIGVKRF